MMKEPVIPVFSKTGFVYLWTNVTNGKKYLGSHVGTPDDGYVGSGTAFQRALKKYGIESFNRVIVESDIPGDLVRSREQHYLDLYQAAESRDFYNLSPEARGGFRHINQSPLKAKYQAQALAGFHKMMKEKGHPRGMAGKSHSEETKKKQSVNIQKAIVTLKGRAVMKSGLDGLELERFDSITDGARSVSGSPSNIKYTCEGRFKTAYGFKWSYL